MFCENMAMDDAAAMVRGSLSVNAETTCLEGSKPFPMSSETNLAIEEFIPRSTTV